MTPTTVGSSTQIPLIRGSLAGLVLLASGAHAVMASSARTALDTALDGAIRGGVGLERVEIRLIWRCSGKLQSSELFGTGVGIWNEEVQFPLSRRRVLAVLNAIRVSRFADLRDRYGEGRKLGEPLRMKGKLSVRIGSASKSVLQLGEGEQSERLEKLADRILRDSERWARRGVRASSLQEALEKLGAGELAAETLRVTVQERGGRPQAVAEEGWLLRMNGRDAIGRPFHNRGGFGDQVRLTLSGTVFSSVIDAMRKANLESLSPNLYAPHYADLSVEVLNRSRALQGRRSLGLTPETHGRDQLAFERLLRELRRVYERVLTEGERFSEPESAVRSSLDTARRSLRPWPSSRIEPRRRTCVEGKSVWVGKVRSAIVWFLHSVDSRSRRVQEG